MKPKFHIFRKISGLFAQDSAFMQEVGKVLRMAGLNIALLISLLPVVTGGCGLIALYTEIPNQDKSFEKAFLDFFRKAHKNFRRSLIPWLLMLIGAIGLGLVWHLVLVLGQTNCFLLMLPLFMGTAVYALLLVWIFPILAQKQDLKGIQIFSLTLLVGLKELPRTLIAILVETVLLLLPLLCTSLTRIGIWLFFGLVPFCNLKFKIIKSGLEAFTGKNPNI